MVFLVGLVVGIVLTVLYRKFGVEDTLKNELAKTELKAATDARSVVAKLEGALAKDAEAAKAEAAKLVAELKAKL